MKIFLLFCGLIIGFQPLLGQKITGISTQWNDSFKEWIIYTDEEGLEGELRLQWPARDDWREWSYRIGEWTGNIRAKWPNRYDEWEVRGENLIARARMLWRNDPGKWRISGPDGRQYKWSSRYGNILEEWVIETEDYGFMEMYTAYEGDPRDWVVVDELDASLPEKMLLIFITLFNSTPKE